MLFCLASICAVVGRNEVDGGEVDGGKEDKDGFDIMLGGISATTEVEVLVGDMVLSVKGVPSPENSKSNNQIDRKFSNRAKVSTGTKSHVNLDKAYFSSSQMNSETITTKIEDKDQ